MMFNKFIIFLLVCLALKCSDATLESLQSYYNQSSVETCVMVPVAAEAQKDPFTIDIVSKPSHGNFTQLNESGLLSNANHGSNTNYPNISTKGDVNLAPVGVEVHVTQKRVVIQYYAKVKENRKVLFFVGECQIGPEHLQQGYHKLKVQEIVHNKKLWLEVWWDDQEMYFEANMNRPIWSDMYEPSYIEVLAPPDYEVPQDSVCHEVLNAMAMTSDVMPYQMAVVASSIIGVLVLLGAVAFLLARRFWKSDTLPIAEHKSTPGRVHNYVAGFDQSYSSASIDTNYQYQPIE